MSIHTEPCPLCYKDRDEADMKLFPCPCGYQMCYFCYNQLKKTSNICPQCRREFGEPEIRTPISQLKSPSESQYKTDLKTRSKIVKKPSSKKVNTRLNMKHGLIDVRVLQYNLVYVVGIPQSLAQEKILRSYEYFGQYGVIQKVVVNNNKPHNIDSTTGPTVSAYLTFKSREDASVAIYCTSKISLESCLLKSSYGTTKYCTQFLKNIECTNPDCMYLHELGADEDSFTKEDIQNQTKKIPDPQSFIGITRLTQLQQKPSVLPPPCYKRSEFENPRCKANRRGWWHDFNPEAQFTNANANKHKASSTGMTLAEKMKNNQSVPPPSVTPSPVENPSSAPSSPSSAIIQEPVSQLMVEQNVETQEHVSPVQTKKVSRSEEANVRPVASVYCLDTLLVDLFVQPQTGEDFHVFPKANGTSGWSMNRLISKLTRSSDIHLDQWNILYKEDKILSNCFVENGRVKSIFNNPKTTSKNDIYTFPLIRGLNEADWDEMFEDEEDSNAELNKNRFFNSEISEVVQNIKNSGEGTILSFSNSASTLINKDKKKKKRRNQKNAHPNIELDFSLDNCKFELNSMKKMVKSMNNDSSIDPMENIDYSTITQSIFNSSAF
eukprot:TRINITY_DN1948_c0_g1_i1.p1 TRINITY_DN1948_c0_g1~~TRINITY_DN1948_c0_g1_i1.p1  ORF type:complete len:607 (-),score=156.13 TRINITY_DN1948_c0_g1_i1:8-1828(-)